MTNIDQLSPSDTAILHAEIQHFLGDYEGELFTPKLCDEFIEMARSRHLAASDSRIAAIASVYFADSRGWHDMAEGIRKSIAAGLA